MKTSAKHSLTFGTTLATILSVPDTSDHPAAQARYSDRSAVIAEVLPLLPAFDAIKSG